MTEIGPEEARATAAEAFLFGYPLVLMDLTGAVMTNVPSASEGNAPINQSRTAAPSRTRRSPPW